MATPAVYNKRKVVKNLITMIYTAMLLVFPITPWADHHATSEPLFLANAAALLPWRLLSNAGGKARIGELSETLFTS